MADPRNIEKRRPFVLVVTEDRAALASVAGALGVIAGSVLTWATVPLGLGTVAVGGLEANGKITVVLGVIALALVAASLRVRGRDLPVAAAVVGLGSAAVAIGYLRDLNSATAQVLDRFMRTGTTLDPDAMAERFGANAGPGVWVVLGGAIMLTVAAAVLLVRDRGVPRQ